MFIGEWTQQTHTVQYTGAWWLQRSTFLQTHLILRCFISTESQPLSLGSCHHYLAIGIIQYLEKPHQGVSNCWTVAETIVISRKLRGELCLFTPRLTESGRTLLRNGAMKRVNLQCFSFSRTLPSQGIVCSSWGLLVSFTVTPASDTVRGGEAIIWAKVLIIANMKGC